MNIKGYELFVYLKLQVPLSPTSLICGLQQLRNLRFCMPQDSWQTLLTFAAAGLMAFTGSSFSVAAGAPVLTEDETAENAGRASFKSTNPRVIFVLGMQTYQVFSMMNVDHALLQKKIGSVVRG
jgi:hypothetical protein